MTTSSPVQPDLDAIASRLTLMTDSIKRYVNDDKIEGYRDYLNAGVLQLALDAEAVLSFARRESARADEAEREIALLQREDAAAREVLAEMDAEADRLRGALREMKSAVAWLAIRFDSVLAGEPVRDATEVRERVNTAIELTEAALSDTSPQKEERGG